MIYFYALTFKNLSMIPAILKCDIALLCLCVCVCVCVCFIHVLGTSSRWRCAELLSHVWFFATIWTIACQTSLSMGFPRQEYWSASRDYQYSSRNTISYSRGSSQPRDWTCMSCFGRWILHHWATWEKKMSVLQFGILLVSFIVNISVGNTLVCYILTA